MTVRVAVIGGGEHARVVIETARSVHLAIEGFLDPRPCEDTQQRLGVPWLGDDAVRDDLAYVLGVGGAGIDNVRARLVDRYATATFVAIVHANAWVSPTARVHAGAVVLAGAVIQSGAEIGPHAIVGSGAVIEHDVVLGAFVQAAPGVVIGGGAHIGDGSYLGIRACVRDHVTIGARTLVGMGAVVTSGVDAGLVVMGVPARVRT
ncbi:MAG TPA: NeuD/PglB/VioB family sugar acetyltransferase [Kofleriaceae bacterium]|nr:NeuD/PglB/VioB family sugar acetyltransferase [Kofleriaceae bacterium]